MVAQPFLCHLNMTPVSAIVRVVRESTDRWTHRLIVALVRAAWFNASRTLAAWGPRILAILIVVELGLLSPLSCVIHCLVRQILAERHGIVFFLCGEHHEAANALSAAPGAAPTNAPEPVIQITPRAIYELVALTAPLLILTSLLVARLIAPRLYQVTRLNLPPPTPPPRQLYA